MDGSESVDGQTSAYLSACLTLMLHGDGSFCLQTVRPPPHSELPYDIDLPVLFMSLSNFLCVFLVCTCIYVYVCLQAACVSTNLSVEGENKKMEIHLRLLKFPQTFAITE
jgi:hypothetical protein